MPEKLVTAKAFAVTSFSGNPYFGIVSAALAGGTTAAVFAVFVLGLATNQVATGLALTIFGAGLSGLIGAPYVGGTIEGLNVLAIPFLSDQREMVLQEHSTLQ